MWRAGGAPQTHDGIAAPYAFHMSGNWQAAAEAWREIGCPYEEAIALADGDEPAKLAGLEILERLGAGPPKEVLSKALRATGVRSIRRGPRPSTKNNPHGLTNCELEVLRLMAQGFGTPQISQRLFISSRTVDHHVSAVFAKLEVHSKSEAVALAFQSGLVDQNK